MWNIDIENRVRELEAQAKHQDSRPFDTMTDTDDSAKPVTLLLKRIEGMFTRLQRGFRRQPRRTPRTAS